MNYLDYIFIILTFAWYGFYALTLINYSNSKLYFENFSFYYQVYVCLLIIYYFNPYMNVSLTKVKKQMIFSSALMLLFSIGIHSIFNKIKNHLIFIKDKVKNY